MGVAREGNSCEAFEQPARSISKEIKLGVGESRDQRARREKHRPRRLLILLLRVRSGRSMVFATARTIKRLCRKPGQLKKLYMTLWFLVTSWSSSSISTTHGTRRGLGWSNSLSSRPSAWVGLTRSPLNASHKSEYA